MANAAAASSKRVIIGGGSGFVGTVLTKALQKHGFTPTVVSRKPQRSEISWDALASDGLPHDTVAVVNLAGKNIADMQQRFDEKYKQEVRDSWIKTTKLFRDLIVFAERKPKVFISTSAVGFYPSDAKETYTEEWTGKGTDFFAKLCQDWEEAAVLPAETNVRHVTVRFGVVLGRSGGMISRLYWPFYLGFGGRVGSGRQLLPWIHIDDLCGIIKHAIVTDTVEGVLNGVAPSFDTNGQFTTAFAKALGRPAFFPVPSFVMNLLMGPERAEMVLTGPKVWPERTLKSGYEYQYADINLACKQFARDENAS